MKFAAEDIFALSKIADDIRALVLISVPSLHLYDFISLKAAGLFSVGAAFLCPQIPDLHCFRIVRR